MEDTYVAAQGDYTALFAVLDGHAGAAASTQCSRRMPEVLSRFVPAKGSVSPDLLCQALRGVFPVYVTP